MNKPTDKNRNNNQKQVISGIMKIKSRRSGKKSNDARILGKEETNEKNKNKKENL